MTFHTLSVSHLHLYLTGNGFNENDAAYLADILYVRLFTTKHSREYNTVH